MTIINVTGLTSGESDEGFAAVVPTEPGEASAVFGTNYDGHTFNIDVASDSNITAQAFNNVAATATSIKGEATADAYYGASQVSPQAWTSTLAVSAV